MLSGGQGKFREIKLLIMNFIENLKNFKIFLKPAQLLYDVC